MPSLLPVDEERPTNLLDYAPTSDADVGLLGRIGDWIARQQQKSADMGLWTGGQAWEGGHPTVKGVADAAQQVASNFEGGIKAFHGSPHSFERFDTSKIGTGEGAQAYGHGLYAAEAEPTAETYVGPNASWRYGNTKAQTIYDRVNSPSLERGLDNEGWSKLNAQRGFWEKVALGRSPRAIIDDAKANPDQYGEHELAYINSLNPDRFKRSGGHMYEVDINADPDRMLHWDKPLSEQHPDVRERLADVLRWQKVPLKNNVGAETTGGQMMQYLEDRLGKADAAVELSSSGIPGIRYLDQGSRAKGEGTSNFVVFDANTIDILRKYGFVGLLGAGAAAGTAGKEGR
jgi:hypothetical protein